MGIGNTLIAFQNKLVSSSFKWVPKNILFWAKLKEEVRPFWNGKAYTYPMNYLLHVGVINVNYYKSVHHPVLTRENSEHPGNFQNKSVSSAFNWLLSFYFLKWNRYFSACKWNFLESKSQFSFKFCINVQCHIKHNSSILFLAQALYTFVKSSPLKCRFLRFLNARVKIRQIPYVHFNRHSSSSIFASFFIVMTRNFPVNFKLMHFQL